MGQPTPAPRLCRTCDGFPVVTVTTGTRHRDGTRVTMRVTCPACQGTGRTSTHRRAVTSA
ncbi:hypothetical protein [Streptomyces fumanus]|uniref:hypothetical protein n=1 Tax=Streptomyces fumanus TaxID=67302 RepID=UPI001E2BEDB0|nr:hypothetical protein [Streptomyces fumanus]